MSEAKPLSAEERAEIAAKLETPWRVGEKVPLNVYWGDQPMFQCHTPIQASSIVSLLNIPKRYEATIAEMERSTQEIIKGFHVATFDGEDPQDPFCKCGLPMEHWQHPKCPHCADECKSLRAQLAVIQGYADRRQLEVTALEVQLAERDKQITDRDEVLADRKRLVREMDVAMNGKDGAAAQASLCDLVAQMPHLLGRKYKQITALLDALYFLKPMIGWQGYIDGDAPELLRCEYCLGVALPESNEVVHDEECRVPRLLVVLRELGAKATAEGE